MVCTPSRHGMTTSFRWDHPTPNTQKLPTSATFLGIVQVRTLTHGLSECPSSNFHNFPSSCRMFLQQRVQRLSTFRTISAAQDIPQSFHRIFRTKFPQDFLHKVSAEHPAAFLHRCVQRIAAKVLENPVPFPGPQGMRVQCPGLTCRNLSDRPLVDRCRQTP